MTSDAHFILEYDEERSLYRVRTLEGDVVLVDDLGEWISKDAVVHTLTKGCGFEIHSRIGTDDDPERWRLVNPAVTLTPAPGGFWSCRTNWR
jgi:hypothetical protein